MSTSRAASAVHQMVLEWMAEYHRCARDDGKMVCFIDYRNLACMVDDIQMAGRDFDGIITWMQPRSGTRVGWIQTSRSDGYAFSIRLEAAPPRF